MSQKTFLSQVQWLISSFGNKLSRYVFGNSCPPPLLPETETYPKQIDYRDEIVARLCGQKVIVPNLDYLYGAWKIVVHPDTNDLRENLENWFTEYVPTPAQRNKQRKVDNALCTGYFFPGVSREKLFILGSLIAFFFFWDDEIDCGTLTNDRVKTEAYCDDSIAFIRHHMQPERSIKPPAPGRMHNSGAFVEIGKAMQVGSDKASRDRFTDAVCGFISAVRLSQGLWLEGCSTYEDYTKRRIATVGVKPLLMVLQWSYGLSLPQSIYDHEATKAMFREVYIGVYLYNDLVSLKKEVVDGDVDSAIPIMVWQEGITAQEAVDRVVRMIETSWEGLLAAEQKLLKVAQTDQMRRDILQLVAGCKDIVVGHMAYTLRAARYMADATHDKFKAQGGSFKVVL
ncbi:hypothetical protein IAQ61_003345 [Plenodomus lingam]|uniref:uncharacterized protein n=1 Tax=Leptosphaeria maculans TaxID=5022 RepID=UPI00332971E0|nr:hypothetical protein IAQ61_003345 [Plenodomus lingam]